MALNLVPNRCKRESKILFDSITLSTSLSNTKQCFCLCLNCVVIFLFSNYDLWLGCLRRSGNPGSKSIEGWIMVISRPRYFPVPAGGGRRRMQNSTTQIVYGMHTGGLYVECFPVPAGVAGCKTGFCTAATLFLVQVGLLLVLGLEYQAILQVFAWAYALQEAVREGIIVRIS